MAAKGVIFDVDGTLVDTNDAHAWAWEEAFERYGYAVPFDRIRPLIGMGGDNLVPELTDIPKDDPKQKELGEAWKKIFQSKYLHRIRAFPQTRALFERLKAEGLRLGVASSAKKELLDKLLEIAEVRDLVEQTTSSDDASSSKPDPDIVGAALEKLGLSPKEAVMVGDTPYDIEAAGRLGVATIALRCGGFADESLAGAAEIYDDPEDLLGGLERSTLLGKPKAAQANRPMDVR